MTNTSLNSYLNSISKMEVLTSDEEKELFEIYQTNSKESKKAFDRIIECNLKFVVSIAKKYTDRGVSLEDLISEGNLGLIRAIETFDISKGFRFITYAVYWIRYNIIQSIRNSDTVNMTNHGINMLKKVNDTIMELQQEFHREPTIDEISDRLDMDDSRVENILTKTVTVVSIDQPIGDDDDCYLSDIIPDDETPLPDVSFMRGIDKIRINEMLTMISDTESEVLRLFYGIDREPMDYSSIGKQMKYTRERIQQIKSKALRRLRFNLERSIQMGMIQQ